MKFKVHDFVVISGDLGKILKINSDKITVYFFKDLEKSYPDYVIQDILIEYINEIEIWIPKDGEYCWFWNNTKEYIFARFDKFSPKSWGEDIGKYNSKEFLICFAEDAAEYYENNNWLFCEPFAHKIPTFLKDRND